jgi:hypothetical protein
MDATHIKCLTAHLTFFAEIRKFEFDKTGYKKPAAFIAGLIGFLN